MLSHEGLEEPAGLFRIFRNILLQFGYCHSGCIGHWEGGGDRNAQSEPFDVTVKLLRQTERGFQCRVHEIMLFDGNKNGSETHDDLALGFVARPASRLSTCRAVECSLTPLGNRRSLPRRKVFATPVISAARVARRSQCD